MAFIDLASAPTSKGWFEFVLEPSKFYEHVNKDWCEMMSLFLDSSSYVVPIPDDVPYKERKEHALHSLALKVAAFLKWDLNTICENPKIYEQYQLMTSFKAFCSAQDCPEEVRLFAELTYYHWVIKSAIQYQLNAYRPSKNATIIYLSQQQQQQQLAETTAMSVLAEFFSKEPKECSIKLYTQLKDVGKSLKLRRPTIECFSVVTTEHDWSKSEDVNIEEFCQYACYDLGKYYFCQEVYDKAFVCFDMIKECSDKFDMLNEYYETLNNDYDKEEARKKQVVNSSPKVSSTKNSVTSVIETAAKKKKSVENYVFDCMSKFSRYLAKQEKQQAKASKNEPKTKTATANEGPQERSINMIGTGQSIAIDLNDQRQKLFDAGNISMAQGQSKQAMAYYVGSLILTTDYFRYFSPSYESETPIIEQMTQCSIQLGCFIQAVALCQMSPVVNYAMAVKQLNERVSNDCCDDIYECIWDITLLEHIVNIHARRNEYEKTAKAIQLIKSLDLNENNSDEIHTEAIQHRRGRFFRMLANKYL